MNTIKQFEKEKLKVKVFESRKSMGEVAAKEVATKITDLLGQQQEVNMIFAAAPSQNEFLAALMDDISIEWQRINAFHMDEYIGLDKDAPQAFGKFLKERLFSKVNFRSVNYMDGNNKDTEAECRRYTELLKQFPVDIVCMGIGENGHIAFNDPHVALFDDNKLVKVVELDDICRNQQVNDGCFHKLEDVPTHAVTLTIPAIISGKHLFCMVPAKTKAQAVYNTIMGDITEECPASILRTHHHAVMYTDTDSSSLLI